MSIDTITIENTGTTSGLDREALLAAGTTFSAYDSQLPVAERKGYRVVKCLYKTPKGGKAAGANSYIYVPDSITEEVIGENIDKLLPFFISYLQEQENQIVREMHKSGAVTVYPTNIGIQKVIDKLESSSDGARLNKEMLESWFDSDIADNLKVLFADKLQLSTDAPKVYDIVAVYRKKLCSLASPKVHMSKNEATTLQTALDATSSKDTVIGNKLYNRLESMKVSEQELLLAL